MDVIQMALPKYITHPLLLLIAFGGLFALLRLGSVSIQDLQNVHQITAFDKGSLTLEKISQTFRLNDKAFTEVPDDKNNELKKFFVRKYIKLDKLPEDGNINLPVTLYDGSCFTPKGPVNDPIACRPIEITP